MKKLQNFNQFTHQRLNEVNDSFFSFDFLGDLFTNGFSAFSDVLKGKVISYLTEYLGIAEGSIFSKLLQNYVEQIPVSDYYSILFNSKIDAKYLAPKAAQATMEFLTEMGVDGIAANLGVKDRNGYLYRTISEMLTNQITRNGFTKNLESFYLSMFGGLPQSSAEEFQKSLQPQERTKIQDELLAKAKTKGITAENPEEKNAMLSNFFSNLGSLNQANPYQIANTSGEDLFMNLIQPKNKVT
jgi:hypothetical protein